MICHFALNLYLILIIKFNQFNVPLQGKFEGLFPPLLRLASTQFPHLCLVEDGLVVEKRIISVLRFRVSKITKLTWCLSNGIPTVKNV